MRPRSKNEPTALTFSPTPARPTGPHTIRAFRIAEAISSSICLKLKGPVLYEFQEPPSIFHAKRLGGPSTSTVSG
jgi:hypothetical protein